MNNTFEIELLNAFAEREPILEAWGNFINNEVQKLLKCDLDDLDEIIRITPEPRVKDSESFLRKALYRGKNYDDPINDIEDLVGIRFVVLYFSEIKKIQKIIETSDFWTFSKDRDFETESMTDPDKFAYQAIHYVVRSKNDIGFKDVSIPANTPCEIQIKTMLQHAWGEATHDTIYKPRQSARPSTKRLLARTTALMEITDNIFKSVDENLRDNEMKTKSFDYFRKIYQQNIDQKIKPDKAINDFILDAYLDIIPTINQDEIETFFNAHSVLFERIKEKYDYFFLYRQPISLLMYFLLYTRTKKTKRLWPLTNKEIQPFLTDLGIE